MHIGADNFYYPPDYEPGKPSEHNVNPLRERAKMLDKGVLVVRFEMPYSVWCTTCNAHIGRGVRYNARKKCIGKYFSTKIWEFSMLCVYCQGVHPVYTLCSMSLALSRSYPSIHPYIYIYIYICVLFNSKIYRAESVTTCNIHI